MRSFSRRVTFFQRRRAWSRCSCEACMTERTAPSRLFSTIAPWSTHRFLSNGEAGSSRPSQRIICPRQREYDLVQMQAVEALYRDARPTIVIHLAAQVGGIGANEANAGKFFYDNLMMGVQLIEVGRRIGLKKLVATGTICAYPKFAPVPFREEDLWNGY